MTGRWQQLPSLSTRHLPLLAILRKEPRHSIKCLVYLFNFSPDNIVVVKGRNPLMLQSRQTAWKVS